MPFRTFIVSDEYFNGFTVSINVKPGSTLQIIIDKVKKSLIEHLTSLNLDMLIKRAEDIVWHIHNMGLDDIIDTDQEVYVCTHCRQ